MKTIVGRMFGRLLGLFSIKGNLRKPNLNSQGFLDLREREAARREYESRRYQVGIFL